MDLHVKAQKSGVQVLSRMEVYGREVNRTQVNYSCSDNGSEYTYLSRVPVLPKK